MRRTKIVVDADVLIHFSKGGCLAMLPDIFPEYDWVVLSVVYKELLSSVKTELDRIVCTFKRIQLVEFEPASEMKREYAALLKRFGRGESACMAYCRYNNDVVGSSNLRDIRDYCEGHQITYLTTTDFLYYAVRRGIMTVVEANAFVSEVVRKGSRLPDIDFNTFVSRVLL